ncbi:MAG: OsmC family protein [Nitrospira sp.]|nr:OsmC family protein [Nitrospira sp.]
MKREASRECTVRLTATYQGGTRYDITNGKHHVVTDQPVDDGGNDAGMSPVELFIGSVASCVAYFVGQFCARHHIPQDGLAVHADWEMAERPHRVGTIDITIHLSQHLPSELKERLLKVAHGCTVHQSVAMMPRVDIKLNPLAPHG